MRVQLKIEGGLAHFPGLSQPTLIDGAALPAEEADELRRLVEAARFFDRPSTVGAPSPGAADYRRYTISIEEGGRQHTVTLVDPVADPDLQKLLRFLQAKARALRRAGPARPPDQPLDRPCTSPFYAHRRTPSHHSDRSSRATLDLRVRRGYTRT
jgi:hypothetical protein